MKITLKDLEGMAEFRLAEQLQRDVWGAGDKEDPADLIADLASAFEVLKASP